ncbi:MAG: hypothetical protein SGILL_007966, partial [Bacillariaceae sp.]
QWIVNKVRQLGGRFLLYHKTLGLYSEQRNRVARKKTSLEIKYQLGKKKHILIPEYAIQAHKNFISSLKLPNVLRDCDILFNYEAFIERVTNSKAQGLNVPPFVIEAVSKLKPKTLATPRKSNETKKQKAFSKAFARKKIAGVNRENSAASLPPTMESWTHDLGQVYGSSTAVGTDWRPNLAFDNSSIGGSTTGFSGVGGGIPMPTAMDSIAATLPPLAGVAAVAPFVGVSAPPVLPPLPVMDATMTLSGDVPFILRGDAPSFGATPPYLSEFDVRRQMMQEEVRREQRDIMLERDRLIRLEAEREMFLRQQDLDMRTLHHPMSLVEREQLLTQRRFHGMDYQAYPPTVLHQGAMYSEMERLQYSKLPPLSEPMRLQYSKLPPPPEPMVHAKQDSDVESDENSEAPSDDVLGIPRDSDPFVRKLALEMAESMLKQKRYKKTKQQRLKKSQKDKARYQKAKVTREQESDTNSELYFSDFIDDSPGEDDEASIII